MLQNLQKYMTNMCSVATFSEATFVENSKAFPTLCTVKSIQSLYVWVCLLCRKKNYDGSFIPSYLPLPHIQQLQKAHS